MIRHEGPLLNWRSRQNVFDCIDNFIGTHGQAVTHAASRFNIGKRTIYTWISKVSS